MKPDLEDYEYFLLGLLYKNKEISRPELKMEFLQGFEIHRTNISGFEMWFDRFYSYYEVVGANKDDATILKITEKGKERYRIEKIKRDREKEISDLNIEKSRFDVKNAKRIFRTYWLTFGMSVIALLISLTLLYLQIVKK